MPLFGLRFGFSRIKQCPRENLHHVVNRKLTFHDHIQIHLSPFTNGPKEGISRHGQSSKKSSNQN